MKKQFLLFSLAIVLAIPFSSCKKDSSNAPSITTIAATVTSSTTATSGGTISSPGSSAVIASGICWSMNANPTITDSKTTDGTLSGSFTSSMSGLTPATLYHVRAYATNTNGTGYGAEVTFTTGSQIKSITFYAAWAGGTEEWDFTYDASGKVTKIADLWENSLDKTLTYDYSVAGKLTIMKNGSSTYGSYDLNASGYITKDDWGNGEYASYDYDANGFVTTYREFWSNADHKKLADVIASGNVTQATKYTDAGDASQIKTVAYTIGDNTNGIFQISATDSDWKPYGNLYGKPCAKLVDYFEYWNPSVSPIAKSRSTYVYTFDTKNRVTKAVKTLSSDNSTEEWNYAYAN